MKKLIFTILLLSLSLAMFAQGKPQKDEKSYGIKFNGFVKTDIFYDTRQNIAPREGHFNLYPDSIYRDKNGNDMNAVPTFHILPIQTRLKGTISGPDVLGAKTSGVIEGEFFGMTDADINGFRLRHATSKLAWAKDEVLFGQTWHPLFITECFPGTISFNTGTMFQPFSRNPQIRYTRKIGGLKVNLTAFSERDFQTNGPEGYTNKYARNAGLPAGNLHLQYKSDSTDHVFGVSAGYKIIQPEMFTTIGGAKYKTSEKLLSYSALAYFKLQFKPITWKTEAVLAQNATDIMMIGGYAVKSITDSSTWAKSFTNINTATIWTELSSNGKKLQFGLFAGFAKNLGSQDEIKTNIYYSRGKNIDHLYRISPRVQYNVQKMSFAFETELTAAAYAKSPSLSRNGLVNAYYTVQNIRALFAVFYNF